MNLNLFEGGSDEGDDLFEDLPQDAVSEAQARSSLHGKEFDQEAFAFLELCGARILDTYVRVHGYPLDAEIEGQNGARFYVDAHGTPDRRDHSQAGMRRTDTMLKFGFKALRLHAHGCPHPLLLLTSHLPKPSSKAGYFLRELNDVLFDAVATVDDFSGQQRLHQYFTDAPPPREHLPAAWRTTQLPLEFALDDTDFE
jgi:hypothetical protein